MESIKSAYSSHLLYNNLAPLIRGCDAAVILQCHMQLLALVGRLPTCISITRQNSSRQLPPSWSSTGQQ